MFFRSLSQLQWRHSEIRMNSRSSFRMSVVLTPTTLSAQCLMRRYSGYYQFEVFCVVPSWWSGGKLQRVSFLGIRVSVYYRAATRWTRAVWGILEEIHWKVRWIVHLKGFCLQRIGWKRNEWNVTSTACYLWDVPFWMLSKDVLEGADPRRFCVPFMCTSEAD